MSASSSSARLQLVQKLLCLALVVASFRVSSAQRTIAECPVLSCIDNEAELAASSDSPLDLFPVKVTPLHAHEWTVTYNGTYKVVWNEIVNEQYILYYCGTSQPNASLFSPAAKFIEVPVQRVCFDSTITSTYLELLDLRPNVTAAGSPQYLDSACLAAMYATGRLLALPDPFTNASLRQQIISTSCDLVFSDYASSDSRIVQDSVSLETSYLGRAEWIKFHALFFNKEAAALDLFGGIQSRFNALVAEATSKPSKPVVAWIVYTAAFPSFNITASYSIENTELRRQAVIDAGGIPLNVSTLVFSNPNDLMNVLTQENVTIIIDETYSFSDATYSFFLDTWNLTAAQAASMPFAGNVWRDDRYVIQNQDDWFETAYPNADAVQNDLIAIIQPSVPTVPRLWFRNLAANETRFALLQTCFSINQPMYPYLASSPPATYTCPSYLTTPLAGANTTTTPTTAATTAAPTITVETTSVATTTTTVTTTAAATTAAATTGSTNVAFSYTVTVGSASGCFQGSGGIGVGFYLNGENRPALSAKVGDTINFSTSGLGIHLFTLTPDGGGGGGAVTAIASLSGTDSISWVPSTAGTYYYVCTVPGHTCMGNSITIANAT